MTTVKHLEDNVHELLSKVSKCNSVSEVKKRTVGAFLVLVLQVRPTKP